MRRAFLLLLLGSLLALTWWRTPRPPRLPELPFVTFTPLDTDGLERLPAGMTLAGAWQLTGRNDHFGGYSALVPLGEGRFLAGSDRGRFLRFSDPTRGSPATEMGWLAPERNADKTMVDIESLTRDAATGRIWAGYEGYNAIERLTPDLRLSRRVRPAAMRDWPSNGGPEGMTRLRDGRFIVLAETPSGWFDETSPAVLFPRDPVVVVKPIRFRFKAPQGYRATDIAQLPDGRVLMVARSVKLGLPPHFSGKLLLADPRTIKAGKVWSGKEIALLDGAVPMDNFEGLAIVPLAEGAVEIWLVSDDNTSLLQRTLLLKLRWTPPPIKVPKDADGARKKARRDAARHD